MQRRATYTPARGRARRIRAPRRTAVIASVAVLIAAGGAAIALPEPSTAATATPDGVVTLVDCVQAWMHGDEGAFQKGGVCVTAQQVLASRIDSTGGSTDATTPAPDASASEQATPSSSAAATAPATAAPDPTPTTTGTSASTAAPTQTVAPATSDVPVAAAAATVPFASRPQSGVITCKGESGVVISGKSFTDIRNDTPAITIDGCHDVLIKNNDFSGDAEPIYVRNSTDVRIVGNRYRDITGPHERNGSHRGNFTQWENSFGGEIRGNIGVGGDTEDVVSIYGSGGTSAADPLVIADNVFQGTNWTSASGSGIMVGDSGGSHVLVQGNTLIDVGQVGIGVAGGNDIRVIGNTVVGRARLYSNVGIYTWAQGSACSDITVQGNTIDFVKADGTWSPMWNGGNCGVVAGWDSNQGGHIDVSGLLPNL